MIKCKINIMNATHVVMSSLQRLGEGLPRPCGGISGVVMAKGTSHHPWPCSIIGGAPSGIKLDHHKTLEDDVIIRKRPTSRV
jgi:hypothetical protein